MAREATVLSIVQSVSDRLLTFDRPSALYGSSNDTARQLLEMFHATGSTLMKSYPWPVLLKRHTITLADGEGSYALPGDYDRQQMATHWDANNFWQIIGPVSDQEWELEKKGIVADGPRFKFTIRGAADNQFLVDPIPDSSHAGQELSFVYRSDSWLRPKTWASSTSFTAGSYCFYNGNVYSTTSGGTTGATAPTHTTGSVSDGGVTWDYSSDSYDRVTADTDIPLFDADLMTVGVMWRFLRENRYEYQDHLGEYNLILEEQQSAARGSRILSLTPAEGIFTSATPICRRQVTDHK